MHDLIQTLAYVNLGAFLVLAAASVRLWLRRREAAAFWAMLAFGDLAVISVAGRILPADPAGLAEHAAQRIDIALLLLFPFLLFRFTCAFAAPPRRLALALRAMTVAMLAWTFALPSFPAQGEPRSALFDAYLAGFLVHWTVLAALSAWRLWRAADPQPSIARRRMRLLAGASAVLTLALFLVVLATDPDSPLDAAAQALAFVGIVGFLGGLAPPLILRLYWRAPEQRRLQEAISSLVELATTREEVAVRVLEPMAALIGANALELRGDDGSVVSSYVLRGASGTDTDALEFEIPGGALVVHVSPYSPFFGEDELYLLRTLAALTGIAIDRVRLFEQEHESRVALERGHEVMANFVSLAAHELRTPVTTIHGFVYTLNHLGDRLSGEQRDELGRTLEQQTQRMALLVEQLLDLSRLDADAIEILPQRLDVRQRVDDLLAAAAPGHEGELEVEVEEGLEVVVDPNAFDRILSNLVTNAFRYGRPPVRVRAEQTDRHFRLAVEDRGPGVPADFVAELFERFTRSDASRERAVGTGLGLAIARSYARAHGGDVVYEPAAPHGARFQFVLPVSGART